MCVCVCVCVCECVSASAQGCVPVWSNSSVCLYRSFPMKRPFRSCCHDGGEPVSDSMPSTGPPLSKRGKRDTTRAEAETASASSLAAPAVLAPGLAPEPFVAGAKAAPSPPYPGHASALPSSASQPAAEAEVISASPLAVPTVLAPDLPPEPYAECGAAITSLLFSESPETPPDCGEAAEAEATCASPLAASVFPLACPR